MPHKFLTDAELTDAESRLESSRQMVQSLCTPKGHQGHRDWMMSIPARPDYDPDLVLSASLRDVDKLLADIREYRNALLAERILGEIDHTDPRQSLALSGTDSQQFSDAADLILDGIEDALGLIAPNGRDKTKKATVDILAWFCLPNPDRCIATADSKKAEG